MRRRTLIVLFFIVLLPLVVLVWISLQLLTSEQQAVAHRLQQLITVQLASVEQSLQAFFTEQQAELLADVPSLNNASNNSNSSTNQIRAYDRQQAIVRQVFIMDADGQRLHPPENAVLTESEQRFLARTADLWTDKAILYQQSDEGQNQQQQSESNAGWYVWHWGSETNFIFWQRTADNHLIGFELESVRVLADLINRLPATAITEQDTNARIQLVDNKGVTIYQWGSFDPAENTAPLLVRPLTHPLGSWKLTYFAPEIAAGRSQLWLVSGLAIVIVSILLIGMAYYLYREHTRELRLAQQRVNFVNQVSHELKTPLTNIRLYAELLDEELFAEEEKPRRYLAIIVSESQRLSRLITNVLSFAGLHKQSLKVHYRSAVLDEIVAKTLAAFRPLLEAKGVLVSLAAKAPATVNIDPDMVEQILNNLLSNVEKYGTSGGKLEIVTWQQAGRSFVRLQDYGPGIAKRDQERIFQPFYRVSSKLSDGVTGTGIGLAITRDLARLHGGNLQLMPSEQGACFLLSLATSGEIT